MNSVPDPTKGAVDASMKITILIIIIIIIIQQ
jgi:hypothetical protein